ncbi:hypothetical protein NQ315_008219 [Exocentrus adspersus]|uniref:DDE Tnp4 domain-containing protein n=1 Tax=Exocentrus adspersus TaxID=1586481 RepID=A0AAV8VM84_9CUCU|nr:hypothetical protein NQ315_008219 [Exocentrus adspersus]
MTTNTFKLLLNVTIEKDINNVLSELPLRQHDSYIDRYHRHSVNLMAICTYDKVFTYVFVGYPGAAHDSRVFSNSRFVRNVERFGKLKYFPEDDWHIIGDAAFPLRTWLITPYSRNINLTACQRYHNRKLSSDRVRIENTFSCLKLRWRRLNYIDTSSISKAIEIITSSCVLHNFCIFNKDYFQEDERNV